MNCKNVLSIYKKKNYFGKAQIRSVCRQTRPYKVGRRKSQDPAGCEKHRSGPNMDNVYKNIVNSVTDKLNICSKTPTLPQPKGYKRNLHLIERYQ